MKKLIMMSIFMCSIANASYTPHGASSLQVGAVIDAISVLVSEESAENPWQGYSIKSITFQSDSLVRVVIVDEWTEVDTEKTFDFKVTEKNCGYSSCGFQAELVQ